MGQTTASRKDGLTFVATLFITLALAGVNAFVWYPAATTLGMPMPTARLVAQGLVLLVGLALTAWASHTTQEAGLTTADLGRAVLAIGAVYVLFLSGIWGLRRLGYLADGPLLRDSLAPSSVLSHWLMDGLGEALLFAGALYVVTVKLIGQRNAWAAIWLTACLAVLYNLIGYLSVGRHGDDLLIRMATDLVTWLLLCGIMAAGHNLWLVALASGNAVYGLSPLVSDDLWLALSFMVLVLVAAFLFRRSDGGRRA